jgi:prostaglandin-E synthase 1
MGNVIPETFVMYAVTCLVLCVNLLFLWGYSGAARSRSKTAINTEDGAAFGVRVLDVDPPAVARVLRAHQNAQASIYPFLFLGFVLVLAGGSAGSAAVIFGVFVAARIAHSIVYLAEKQPWRTGAFVVGALATLALMIDIVWRLVQGPAS